jgi:hypothetical protein
VGTPKGKGGFAQQRTEKTRKRQQRAEELKVGTDEKISKEIRKTEQDLQDLKILHSKELSKFDRLIEAKEKELSVTSKTYNSGSYEAKKVGIELQNLRDQKKALRQGVEYKGDKEVREVEKEREVGPEKERKVMKADVNGVFKEVTEKYRDTEKYKDFEIVETTNNAKSYDTDEYNKGDYTYIDDNGEEQTIKRSIHNMETIELVNKKQAKVDEDRNRMKAYVNRMNTNTNKVINMITSLGSHSNAGLEEASHKILMDIKVDDKK